MFAISDLVLRHIIFDGGTDLAQHEMFCITISILIGILCDCNVQFCSCLPEFVQLLQFGVWGGTPSKPRIAFALNTVDIELNLLLKTTRKSK